MLADFDRTRVRRLLVPALLFSWATLMIVLASRTWLPSGPLLKKLLNSFVKLGTPEAGIFYALHHHLEMIGKVCVLHLVLAGAGIIAVRWITPRFRRDWIVAWGIGFGLISLLTLALGLNGLIYPATILAPSALVGAAGLICFGRGGTRQIRDIVRDAFVLAGPLGKWLAGAAAVAAVMLLGLALAPDSSWDAVVYHLRVPAFYMQEHRVFYMPTHHFTAFPLATEMHNIWLMLWGGLDRMGGGQAPKVFHLSCAFVAALCAFRLTRRLVATGSRDAAFSAAWLALVLVLVCPFTGTIAVRGYNDFVQAALTAIAIVVLVERVPGAVRLAGAICGVALSVKYTAVMVLLPVGLLWFRLRLTPYVLAGVLVAPWVIKNAILTGNPAAPFLTSLFPSSPESQFQLKAYADSVGAMSMNLSYVVRAAMILLRTGADEHLTELLPALLPVAFLFGGRPGPAMRKVALFTASFTVLWMILTPNLRFYAAALGPLAALAATGFLRAGAYGGNRWMQPALGLFVVLNLVRLPLGHVRLFDPLPFTVGRETVWDHATRSLFPAPFFGRAIRAANRDLPADARVLVVIDIKAHYLWRRTYHDFQYITPGLYLRWLRSHPGSVDGLLKKLRQEGVTHLLMVEQRTRDVGRHYSWRGDELAITARFLAFYTVTVAKVNMVEVLEILPEQRKPRDLDGYGWLLFMHSENLMLGGRGDEAQALMAETIKRVPWLRGARTHLGVALSRNGHYDEALRVLGEGLAEGGEYAARAAYVIGQVKRHRGDLRGAEIAWRKVVELEPTHHEARFNLGVLLYDLGKKEDGLRQIAVAAQLRPGNTTYVQAFNDIAQELGIR